MENNLENFTNISLNELHFLDNHIKKLKKTIFNNTDSDKLAFFPESLDKKVIERINNSGLNDTIALFNSKQ